MARVTTGTGDEGYTDLLGAQRVPKYHRRPETYGTVDEATSMLGLARAYAAGTPLADDIRLIQSELYILMAELATPPQNYDKVDFKITREHVGRLDAEADRLKSEVQIGNKFIIPGDTLVGAGLDVARTVVRRAERQVARLYHDGDVTNVEALRYLNRLSDLLFIMARWEESRANGP
jgi:cob(I)alamin adenosyltransferase